MIKKYATQSLGLDRYKGLSLEELFVQLCAYTTPYGSEHMLLGFFPNDSIIDEVGNIHYIIPEKDGSDPIVQFSSHLDTACSCIQRVNMVRKGDKIFTDGSTVLSADCKIGVAIMLKMIEARVPGWYVFHIGEESGCIGSKHLADTHDKWLINPKISIALDRHSYGSIITHQCSTRCCSEEFSAALAKQLIIPGYKPYSSDNGGLYTDNYQYEQVIPEVTNISVGYFKHHTHAEHQDIKYAYLLLTALLKVDWHSLPVVRDPKDISNKSWYGIGQYYGDYSSYWNNRIGGSHDKESVIFPDDPDMMNEDQWKSKYHKPVRVSDGHYMIRCAECNMDSEFDSWDCDTNFKFCEHCGEPLDEETACEVDTIRIMKEKENDCK